MRFVLADGALVTGRGYADIVKAMNEEKFTPAKNISTYRKAVARRVREVYGEQVDDSSDKALIESLIKVGLITRTDR